MKYLITESKLDSVIFKYLDMKLSGVEKREGKNYDIIFGFPNKDYGLIGWEKSGNLYVFYKLSDEIQDMFGLESLDILDVIGRYVEDRFHLKVRHTHDVVRNYGLRR